MFHVMGDGIRVLVAEDNEEEIVLYKHAFNKIGIREYDFVHNGEDVIHYLRAEGKYSDREKYPFPTWLLLDLKMPKVSGLEVLEWLREHPACRVVPTVIMSNSNQPSDIIHAYQIGVNAFFTKPTMLNDMINTVALLCHFWTVAQRPPAPTQLRCNP